MIARWIVVLLCWSILASSGAGQGWLVTRLWFENLTRGTDNASALLAEPGDRIAIRFMTQVDPLFVMKWGTFQATLILDGLTLMSDDDANTWAAQTSHAFTPPTWFPIKIFHQPDYGPLYDNAGLPSDSQATYVADRALYVLIGATGRDGAQNASRKLFEFTVQPGSVGEELHWSFPGRATGTGLSTRVIDSRAVSRDPTDNFVRVVPEPSAVLGLLGGLALLRRQRVPRCAPRAVSALVLGFLVLLPMSANAVSYQARLWFRNLTTGYENPGDLIARPGDEVAIRFFWDFGGDWTSRWSILQVTLLIDGLNILSEAEANTWAQQFVAALTPPSRFPMKYYHQPSFGPLYDHALEPYNPDWPLVADAGLYGLAGVTGSEALVFNRELFRFTVQPGSEGQVLDWALDGRVTERGLSTRVLDYYLNTVDVTDNRVLVVPEPTAAVALLVATTSACLRRRRG